FPLPRWPRAGRSPVSLRPRGRGRGGSASGGKAGRSAEGVPCRRRRAVAALSGASDDLPRLHQHGVLMDNALTEDLVADELFELLVAEGIAPHAAQAIGALVRGEQDRLVLALAAAPVGAANNVPAQLHGSTG